MVMLRYLKRHIIFHVLHLFYTTVSFLLKMVCWPYHYGYLHVLQSIVNNAVNIPFQFETKIDPVNITEADWVEPMQAGPLYDISEWYVFCL